MLEGIWLQEAWLTAMPSIAEKEQLVKEEALREKALNQKEKKT